MSTSRPRNIHPALQAFADKKGLSLDTLATIGKLVITIDDEYRIHIYPSQGNILTLSSYLCDLPDEDEEKKHTLINMVLNLAYATAKDGEAYIAIEPDQSSLQLQLQIPSHIGPRDFEKKLDHFVLQFRLWRDYIRKNQ
jgi:hypothetical protein